MYVYFILAYSPEIALLKVGKARNPARRMSEMQTACPFEMKMLAMLRCKTEGHALALEKKIHRNFKKSHYRGEWFRWDKHVKGYLYHAQTYEDYERCAEDPVRTPLDEEFRRIVQ